VQVENVQREAKIRRAAGLTSFDVLGLHGGGLSFGV
jgi:hypothetical protein